MLALAIALAASPIVGTWEGTSLCQVKPSSCRDEHVIYRVTAAGSRFHVAAYKLVGGEEQYMGDIDLGWVGGTLSGTTLDRAGRANRWTFTRTGTHLSGRLVTPDGRLFRKIEVDHR